MIVLANRALLAFLIVAVFIFDAGSRTTHVLLALTLVLYLVPTPSSRRPARH